MRDVKFNEEKLGIELLKNRGNFPTIEMWMPDYDSVKKVIQMTPFLKMKLKKLISNGQLGDAR